MFTCYRGVYVCLYGSVFCLWKVSLGSSNGAQELWGFKGKPPFRTLQLDFSEIIYDLHHFSGMWPFSPDCGLYFELWIKADGVSWLKSSCCNPFKVLPLLKNHGATSSAASEAEVETSQDGFWGYPPGERLLKRPPLSRSTWAASRKQLLEMQKAGLESGSWLKS